MKGLKNITVEIITMSCFNILNSRDFFSMFKRSLNEKFSWLMKSHAALFKLKDLMKILLYENINPFMNACNLTLVEYQSAICCEIFSELISGLTLNISS